MKTSAILGLASACLLTPAMAQDAKWELYGTLIAFGENIRMEGATTSTSATNTMVPVISPTATNMGARNRITCSTSNIGFKGGLTLSPGLKVIWQVESAISVDGDMPNTLAGRNSALGLAGDAWGRVFIGNWDTPYKLPQAYLGPMRGLLPFDNNITANPGFNVPGTVTKTGRAGDKSDASFSRRQGNSIQYWSPEWKGWSAQVAYSVNETKPASDAPTQAQYSPTILSALVQYKWGTLNLFFACESHKDYFGLSQLTPAAGSAGTLTNSGSRDLGLEFAAFYVIPATGTRLTVLAEQLSYKNDDTVLSNVDEYKRTAWFAFVQQSFQAHKVWVGLGKAGEGSVSRGNGGPTSAAGLGATQFSLGYSYAANKVTDLFLSYHTMANDHAATYGLFPQVSGTAVNPGATTRGFGAGMLYKF